MKIGPSDNKPIASPSVTERGGDAGGAAKAGAKAAPVEASAAVELSSTATELSAGGTDASFDAEKVERISKAIADGTFKVNPEVIADKLIANAQEVLGKVNSH